MRIKAYTCPSCGAPLDVKYDTTFTCCPHCGCKVHISSIPSAIQSGFRDFVEPEIYLQQYAQQVLNVPVTPVAKTALPSRFGKICRRKEMRYGSSSNLIVSISMSEWNYPIWYVTQF